MKSVPINEQVAVTQIGFKKNLATYPRRMEFRGAVYEFLDAGLRCLVKRGNQLSEIITLTDGTSQFRLRSDNRGGDWTLLSIVTVA